MMFNFFKKKVVAERDFNTELQYRFTRTYGEYRDKTKLVVKSKEDLSLTTNDFVIETIFNGKSYLVYDIDDITLYNHYISNYDINGAIWRSSTDHHWLILDQDYKTIFSDLNQVVYSHYKYIEFSKKHECCVIRGTYKNFERQPRLIKNYSNDSDFILFNKKLEEHYNNFGLVMSIKIYKDPELLLHYNRKMKLKTVLEK